MHKTAERDAQITIVRPHAEDTIALEGAARRLCPQRSQRCRPQAHPATRRSCTGIELRGKVAKATWGSQSLAL